MTHIHTHMSQIRMTRILNFNESCPIYEQVMKTWWACRNCAQDRVISKEIIDAEKWNKCALFNIFKIGTNMCMISSWFPHDFFMIFHEKSCTYFYIFPRYKYVKMCAWFVMCMIPPWFPTEICRNVCMISLWISTHLGMSHVTHESSCHNNE